MVDWKGRMLNIPTSKNGEALHVPLNNAALAALRTVHQRGQKSGRVFQSEKTGKPLANSRMKGAKLEDIATLLAHKGLTMTKRCAHGSESTA
jgi:hypothetical protein